MYASYEYYVGNYLGSLIPEADFAAASLRASRFLDYYTQNRAKDNAELEAVKMACCALADEYYAIETAQRLAMQTDDEMQSQTVGSYSVTYRSKADTARTIAAEARGRMVAIARQHLAHTGLLYRGGGAVCTPRTL